MNSKFVLLAIFSRQWWIYWTEIFWFLKFRIVAYAAQRVYKWSLNPKFLRKMMNSILSIFMDVFTEHFWDLVNVYTYNVCSSSLDSSSTSPELENGIGEGKFVLVPQSLELPPHKSVHRYPISHWIAQARLNKEDFRQHRFRISKAMGRVKGMLLHASPKTSHNWYKSQLVQELWLW